MSGGARGSTRLLNLWEETMKTADKWRVGKHPLLLLALLVTAFFGSSCRNNEVEVPPLTGPSGHRLFITIEAAPEHLVIHAPGRPRETSEITLQLKNQQGIGVPGENVKLRITNIDFFEVNIGRLSDYNVTTDAAGFARVTYTAPDALEQQSATQVYIRAILTNPAYVDEVTDIHKLDLESSAVQPGTCASNILVPEITADPTAGHLNQPICFSAVVTRGTPPVDVTGRIVAALWDFGDGSRETGLSVCHLYTSAGSFPVSLIVQDVDHNCGQGFTSVTIDKGQPASCSILVSPIPTVVDTNINFTAVVTDPDGRVRRFAWNFGDGSSTSTNRNTTVHRYRNVGTFAVLLTITDDQGNISTCQTTVSVTPPACPTITVNPGGLPAGVTGGAYPTQNFSATGGAVPLTFTFAGTLPTGLTFTPIANGATLSGSTTVAGAFQFSVTATDANGCTGTANYSITVAP